MNRALVLSFAVGVALGADFFDCPANEITGKFADLDECDKYWECFRGVAEAKYCNDGEVFDPKRIQKAEPCDYIFNVDCTGREQIAEPQGTPPCKRRNGVYPHEDPQVCGRYYSCVHDEPTLRACAPGLHFNIDSKLCDWPNSARRGECSGRQKIAGFVCPKQDFFNSDNLRIPHPTFPHPDDCAMFYVCQNGVVPSIARCDDGLVFSTDTGACESPASVPDCADYYTSGEADTTIRS